MTAKRFPRSDADRNKIIAGIAARLIAVSLLALLLIMTLRGVMNMATRSEFISQRLDDYPRLYENYRKETEEWQTRWHAADAARRAELAAFLWQWDDTFPDEEQKLACLPETVGADRIRVADSAQAEALAETMQSEGLDTATAELPGGRAILIGLRQNAAGHSAAGIGESAFFLSQLQAGLPGYVLVLHEGSLSIYPEDENAQAVSALVSSLLASGSLRPAAPGGKSGNSTAFQNMRNPKTERFSAGEYTIHCASYEGTDDLVINAAETRELLRLAGKRSWSLWFLTLSVFLLLTAALFRTQLYTGIKTPSAGRRIAMRRGALALLFACLLLCGCTVVIQLLSGVNQSAQSAEDEAAFLRNILAQEAERAEAITEAFDARFTQRAETAAAILSRNPQLIGTDSLRGLNGALGGAGLCVYDAEGKQIASDDIFRRPPDRAEGAEPERTERVYRAAMTNDGRRTTGYVELLVSGESLNGLLTETRIDEVIGDLHMLDSLHVVAVQNTPERTIAAGTRKSWVGDSAEEYGISPRFLYDGYVGLMNLGGSRLYSIVFAWRNYLIVVASEAASALVFLSGVALLTAVLVLLTYLLYRMLVRELCRLQELNAAAKEPARIPPGKYPPVLELLRGFMMAVFVLSSVLFLTTNGNPTGLTYNLVRGVWVRGFNIVTVTTSIMLASVVVVLDTLLKIILDSIAKYLNPRGRTVCRLIDSSSTYLGVLVMILYTLTMFGVNTSTLVGGVGATALVFTLGANSLIADVLAGMFIIFEGDYTVGDMIVIDGFRGTVTDISMRTTKLMDDETRDIKIINNSTIKGLVNQSRQHSVVIVDITISHDFGLVRGEEIVKREIAKLPEKYPEIIGEPEYWGVVTLPEIHPVSKFLGGCIVRVAFNCLENDRYTLTYQLYRELVWMVYLLLNDDTEVGVAGCRIVNPPEGMPEAPEVPPRPTEEV